MDIGRTRSVSGLGALSAACVTGTVLAITLLADIVWHQTGVTKDE